MKKTTLTCCLVLMVLSVFGSPVTTIAGPATEAVRQPINDGISLLRDQSVETDAQRREQADRIWDILRQAFDFRLISALALGKNWKRFSPDERKEFTAVFSQLLGNTYVTKIQGEYKDEKVLFIGEEVFSKKKAVVKTVIKRQGQEIPVDYKMRFKKGEWKVYDINVEGIGLVLNYRRQFNTFLSKETGTPESLINKLKGKLEGKASKS
ncbi:MAG: ABC transporter substrate-binding protein [Desulfobacterales bacterium]|nr:ABC transporter substrate-binding protein [Desulfobacterales bacterium]